MITCLKNLNKNTSNTISSLIKFDFAQGKWKLRTFKNKISNYSLKDLTKSSDVKNWLETRISEEKKKIPVEKISDNIKENRLSKLNPTPNLRVKNKHNYNLFIKDKAAKLINEKQHADFLYLENKMFALDYTAQVLENMRKDKENKIFNIKYKEVYEKKLAIKLESRKKQNLLENYENTFKNYERHNEIRLN